MNPVTDPNKEHFHRRAFTLIEMLVVVAIIGVLAAILLPALSRALSAAHVNRSVADLKQLRGLVADAANQLGGTLPLTKGYTSTASAVNAASSPNLSSSSVADLNASLRLEEVLMALPSPKLERYFTPACGSQVFVSSAGSSVVDPRYNPASGTFYNSPDAKIPAGYGYLGVSRLDCGYVDTTQQPGSISSSGGTNFRLDGINSLAAGRVAYAVIKGVPAGEAYQIAVAIDTPAMMDDATGAAGSAQVRGGAAYAASVGGVTDVVVYLGSF